MNNERSIICYSPTLSGLIGIPAASVYDYISRWICTNCNKKRQTAYEDGKWWTYGSLEYYVNAFGGGISKRSFQRIVSFLVKNDYLRVKCKGRDKVMWFTLGDNVPDVPPQELPFEGKLFDACRGLTKDAKLASNFPKDAKLASNFPKDAKLASNFPKDAKNVTKDANLASFVADAPSSGAASEPPKHTNKHTNLRSINNIEVSKSEKAPESEKTNQNSLTPMSGIIDTLLNQLQGSSVVVDENLSDVLGIDLNDPSCHDKIVAIGVSLNVERETMSNLIQKYGLPAVAKQLVNLHYQQKVNPAGNPAGWLVSAVARNYALSQQALDCIKTQRQKQKEREEFQAKVARMRAEDAERQKRETEEFRKNGPDFDTMPDILLAAWLRRDSEKFIEKKYRAYLAGKGIPEDQHDKIVEEMRNFHPDRK